jgi:hypothetical protein
MSLPTPLLDDRTFGDLLAEAQQRLRQSCPDWMDASPSDPGAVMLELFSHLTEQVIYRLNRVPDKAYIEFLRLIGVRLMPPSSARATVVFSRAKPGDAPIEIPRGTRITTERAEAGREAPVFATVSPATIPAGVNEVSAEAVNADLVIGEDAGLSTGLPGQSVIAQRAPIIAGDGDELDLVVGIETVAGELPDGATAIQHNGITYSVWQEANDFAGHGQDAQVFLVDRMLGRIQFAPSVRLRSGDALAERATALAAVPAENRRIRLWYRCGGGQAGNVAANRLTVLKDPIPGIKVSNPQAASGGRAAETLDNALERGPFEFFSLNRAVTAFDYELIARGAGAARAKAFTRSTLYKYAQPGSVEVVLVPGLPDDALAGKPVSVAQLREWQTDDALADVRRELDEKRPLGTCCLVRWAAYTSVAVKARVVIQNHLNPETVKAELLQALRQRLSPLPYKQFAGWPFGEALRISHLYDTILAKPGIGYMDRVRLVVEDAPDQAVKTLCADPQQTGTWYAGAGENVFVSDNGGDGWTLSLRCAGERIISICAHRQVAGLIAVSTRTEKGSSLHISRDCGQSWERAAATAFVINDLAWTTRDQQPILMMATSVGLYELGMHEGASPLQILVVSDNQNLGFFAVAAVIQRGESLVTVAAESLGGVYLSNSGGKAGSFSRIGLDGQDVRVLEIMQDGPRSFLWAGLAAAGNENGAGCMSCELRGTDGNGQWRAASKGWQGGSVHALAFRGATVLAASHRSGVMTFESAAADGVWTQPTVECGLPLRDAGRLHPVEAIAADPDGRVVMAGGSTGVFSSTDLVRYACASRREFDDHVSIPQTALLVSGAHELEVVTYEQARK